MSMYPKPPSKPWDSPREEENSPLVEEKRRRRIDERKKKIGKKRKKEGEREELRKERRTKEEGRDEASYTCTPLPCAPMIGIKSLVMSSASSAVTYTSVYTDSEPGRVFWGADEEISDGRGEAFEMMSLPPTPKTPQDKDPLCSERLRKAGRVSGPEPPMSASMKARIAEHADALHQHYYCSSSITLTITTHYMPYDTGAPLGYRAARIMMRAAVASPPSLLPPTSPRTDIPEADMPPQKRACLTTPAPGYEIGESSAAGTARQPGSTPEANTWDEIVEAILEVAPTTLEGVDQRVTELDTTIRQRTEEFQVRFEEAYDDRASLRARVNTLFKDRPYHRHTALALDREAVYAHIAWTGSEERSASIEAHVRTLEAQVATLIAQTTSLQTQLTIALGRIETLEARYPEP
ncbi:hypothetical protein Tco_1377120 [Tanacetum coccineum]